MTILKNNLKPDLKPEHSDNTEPLAWNLWLRNQVWRDKLAKKATYKSLDIVDEDDMNINSGNTTSGVGAKGLIAAGLLGASLLSGGIIGGVMLADRFKVKEPVETIIEHTKVFDSDIEMEIIPPD